MLHMFGIKLQGERYINPQCDTKWFVINRNKQQCLVTA